MHPNSLRDLQALQSQPEYYDELLGMMGASGVLAPRNEFRGSIEPPSRRGSGCRGGDDKSLPMMNSWVRPQREP